MTQIWLKKHQPKKLEEVIGNKTVKEKLKNYSWKKPALIYGPSGIGKTLMVKLLAQELNFTLALIDDDNLERVEEISQTSSLFGNKKLILFDHVEKISKIKKVSEFLKKISLPTILITSDFQSKKLKNIKRSCEKFQMRRPSSSSLVKFLFQICEKEGVKVKEEVLKKIAENAEGDVRAAILDLEMIGKGKREINERDLKILESRDRIETIYKALSSILIHQDIQKAQESTYDLTEEPKDVLLWLDENLPKVYSKKDLQKGFYYLSRADLFLGRIHSRQYWGFLRYANILMTSGVNISKSKKISFLRYQFPFYIIHLSQTRKERKLKQTISEKLSPHLHVSSKIINREYLPLLKILLKNNKITSKELVEKFRLGEEEIDFLKEGD